MANTVQHIVVLEVSHILAGDELHELLCKRIHGDDTDAQLDLRATVHGIQVIGQIKKTG